MPPNRREAFVIGATALLASGAAGAATPGPHPGPPGTMRIFRVFATPDGESHLEPVHVASSRKPLPVQEVLATSFAAGVEDWHHAPFKTFTINTVGQIRAELSDGSSQMIGPGDLVYLEDRSGKGHLTRLLTDGAALFLRMPDDFDILDWART
jgi:hypothetical protein